MTLPREFQTQLRQGLHRLQAEMVYRELQLWFGIVQHQQARCGICVPRPLERSVTVRVKRCGEPDEVVLQVPASGGPEDVLKVRAVRLSWRTKRHK